MVEHRKVCPEVIIQCSMCTNSFKRSELSAHYNDPSFVTTRLLGINTTIEELRCENQRLKRRMEVVTSRDREMLVESLGNVQEMHVISSGHLLAKAMKTVMGAEEWDKLAKPNLKAFEAIVGLLEYLASNHKDIGESYGSVVPAAATSLMRVIGVSETHSRLAYRDLKSVGACDALVKSLLAYPTYESAQSEGLKAIWLLCEAGCK